MAAAKALLLAAGFLEESTATEHATFSSSTATKHAEKDVAHLRFVLGDNDLENTQSSPLDVAMQHGSTATIAEEVSYPPADATEHGSNATLAEDVLEVVIPFLTMTPPAHTMCGPEDLNLPGDHMHVWCHRCANFGTHCAVTHNACSDCRILRTMMQLSERWHDFMWEHHMEAAES